MHGVGVLVGGVHFWLVPAACVSVLWLVWVACVSLHSRLRSAAVDLMVLGQK